MEIKIKDLLISDALSQSPTKEDVTTYVLSFIVIQIVLAFSTEFLSNRNAKDFIAIIDGSIVSVQNRFTKRN